MRFWNIWMFLVVLASTGSTLMTVGEYFQGERTLNSLTTAIGFWAATILVYWRLFLPSMRDAKKAEETHE